MNIFVTSDLHFGHKNIIRYCPESRPFLTTDEMCDAIIQNWNTKISNNDHVYILGDIGFCSSEVVCQILDTLKGIKYLVLGNHDNSFLKSQKFQSKFEWIKDYHELKYNKNKFIMSHYPFLHWNGSHYGSFMLHGHLHSKPLDKLEHRRYDIGIDGSPDFAPYLLDDLVSIVNSKLQTEPTICHHGKTI